MNAGHQVFPYLLSGLTIGRPNQFWASDITYIPVARGFVESLVESLAQRGTSTRCAQWPLLFPI
jgi:hypothetical protein